jgi:hypothetical protein
VSETLAAFEERVRRLGNGGARRVLAGVMRRGAVLGETVAKTQTYPASGLRVRTGALRRSIAGAAREVDAGAEIVLQAGGRSSAELVYASVHEGQRDGERVASTTIRPKNGQYLRIPTARARTAAGVDRMPGPLRTIAPGAFRVVKTQGGKLVLASNTRVLKGRGKNRKPIFNVWYVLVESVTVPARPFLLPAIEFIRPAVVASAAEAIGEALTKEGADGR